MIILGIDPGLANTGYAIIEFEKKEIESIAYGCIETSSEEKKEKRILKIHQALSKIIKKYNPDKIAVEQLFFAKNVSSALIVGQALGITCLCAAEKNIPLYEYTPLQIKQAITGYGKADKEQVQKMLKCILKLKKIPKPDHAADALAVAFCCFGTKEFK